MSASGPRPTSLCFVGAVHAAIDGGGTVKNRLLVDALRSRGSTVRILDTGPLQLHAVWKVGPLLVRLAGERQVLLSLSERGCRVLVPYMSVVKSIRRDVEFVLLAVGSGLVQSIDRMSSPARSAYVRDLKRCSAIYVESTYMMEDLIRLGLPNVSVLPNPRPLPQCMWRESSKGAKRVVFVSRVTETKGVADAAAAVLQLRQEHLDVSLDIFGPIESGFEQRLAEIVAGDAGCTYRGVIASDKVSEVLAGYDALVLPTYWPTEGMPGVLVEAAMVGLPIITSKFDGVDDLIRDTVDGLLVEARDVGGIAVAIKRILVEDGLARHLSTSLRSRVQFYEIGSVVDRLCSNLAHRGWQ